MFSRAWARRPARRFLTESALARVRLSTLAMSSVLHSLERDALSLSSQPRHLHGEGIRIVCQVRRPQERETVFSCHFTEKTFRDVRKLVKESKAEGKGTATRRATLP